MGEGFIDLHSHWVAGIDDGAKTAKDSLEMLTGLADVGFGTVVATPHMRTG
ncbi:MAG: protein tyrosine phosphatase, partial [Deltaproteobacteria bacterium]|nr:protein tyrosine phosphatase [Deltaproteobacteria bacterium]